MPNDIRHEIKTANQAFMDAFAAGDAARLAKLYTDDGKVLPPNSETVAGHDEIHTFWQAVMDMGIKRARLEIDEVEAHGDTATEVSHAALMGEGDEVLDRVKYIVIWKRVDRAWKLHRDIFNSSLPTAG